MAANFNRNMTETIITTHPHWYSSKTGIYSSVHSPLNLPTDPFVDIVSFIFSHPHDGVFALIDSSSGFSISYSKLLPLVKSMASGLHKMGVSQGAVVTPLNPLSSVGEIRKQVNECGVSFAFTVSENVKKIEEDTAGILYSSGTTGVSKGVVLTHRNLIAMVEHFVRFEASQYEYSCTKNMFLAVLPMFHIYGLSLFAAGLLSLGSTIVVMRKFDIDEVVRVIDKYNVTHFPVVPPMVSALTAKAKGVNGSKLKSLRQVSCGAAPLSTGVINGFVRAFPHVDFIQGYGMTESTAVGTRGFNTEKFHNYSSIGLLAPNMEAKVVDWNGSLLPPGGSGELWLRGPSIMKGYLNNEEATMSTIDKDGWLHTGDIVHFDQDGYLHVSDRLKDIIKYKGFQIAPADIEAVLIMHPEIVDVAVTAAKDEETGEIPVAFVVKKVGSVLSLKHVIDYVAEQVAPYKKVRKVFFTDKIPRSPTGKILRKELRHCLISKL
ncbi:4-coumarate-CoA ligase 6-like protein [Trifolium pratense]|uniref:4-coumarate--CoA ligase n=1 Tax=Trifolium pratense TaxID=57577 RepID=A0A2K3MYC0_TRIPR|nr:4-coumarate-CoA ligase 6-like protein [Trifolium pratense]